MLRPRDGSTLVDKHIESLYGTEKSSRTFKIEPWRPENVQPASYDLTLGDEYVTFERSQEVIDIEDGDDSGEEVQSDTYELAPGEMILATTEEYVEIPKWIAGEVKGRSSIGRLGVIPHTAGFIDPGFRGQITLELVNFNSRPVKLKAGMRIAQLVLRKTADVPEEWYGVKDDSKYQGQEGPTQSRIDQDE